MKDDKHEDKDDETRKPEFQSQQQQEQEQQQQQQQQQQHSSSNKRKALEDGLSPDRTRPRYNGITTVVWQLLMQNIFHF